MTDEPNRLRELDPAPGYDSADDALHGFYVPALSVAVSYNRSVGYFRSSSFRVAARGLSHFIEGRGTMRLLVGTDLTQDDCDAMDGRVRVPDSLADRLADELVPEDEIAEHRLAVLAWLVQTNRLVLRIAVPVDGDGRPTSAPDRYFHEKIGVLRDGSGDGVAFQGSVNESATAWSGNFESFSVYRSWGPERPHFEHWNRAFERRWSGKVPNWRMVNLPAALRDRLLSFVPSSPPPARDPEEPPPLGDPATLASYLVAAPRLVGAERLAEDSTPTRLQPHQVKVVERLAGEYPRSWLLADEVGLGKTVSAAMALRRLVLEGQVRRALVLAPAGVCRQWHDELFERTGLWASRFEGGVLHDAHPDDVTQLHADQNPYAARDLLVVSSHLARREDQRELLLDAGPWDVLVVDEAHHARRKGGNPDRYEPGRLLQLLDAVDERQAARAVWLLTATPMQVAPVELRDLLVHVGLHGPLRDPARFERWARELAAPDRETDWRWLGEMLRQSPGPPIGPAEDALLTELHDSLGPAARARIERFGTRGEDAVADADALGIEGRVGLRRWLRLRGPVGRALVRHTRTTLRAYRAAGLLDEPLADRHVVPVVVAFTAAESALYERLDGLIDRLRERSPESTRIGFLLTVYRRRLTSSWAAIAASLERRLGDEQDVLGDDLSEEAEQAGVAGVATTDLALTSEDVAEFRTFLADLGRVEDSKFDRLRRDLDEARGDGRVALVFTQFTDTLDHLRNRLSGVYRSELATYTGAGGHVYDDLDRVWQKVSKQELVEALDTGRVRVLLATDAASEGLNLQAADFLVNYDMPWNPMRVEQRIGRIDRLGQEAPVIEVRNYFIPGTVEERVYELLESRIADFGDLVGNMQPILGAAEKAFRDVFGVPTAERGRRVHEEIEQLGRRIEETRTGGVDLDVEDPLPLPAHPPSPVTTDQLAELLPHLGLRIGHPDRPASLDGELVSRDEDDWCALASYGHPDLLPALDSVAASGASDEALVLAESGEPPSVVAFRADRSPPEPVRGVGDLGELGPASSLGDAESLARERADAADRARADRIRRTEAVQVLDRRQRIRRDLVYLARRQVEAEIVVEAEGLVGEYDVHEVWDRLTAEGSGWQYAETFRQALGVPVDELAPRGTAGADMSLRRARTLTRHDTYPELAELMGEWRRLAAAGVTGVP